MYQLIEIGMAGRVSYILERYSKENNRFMKSYDADKI